MKNWFLSHNESPLALPAVWGILGSIPSFCTILLLNHGMVITIGWQKPHSHFCQRAYIGIVMNALASMCLTMEFIGVM